MKLSIIVPVYNQMQDGKLKFCLDSLLNQTVTDYEIIAVDDKSTDDSLNCLYEYQTRFPERLKVIASPENRRQGGAKNLGLRKASGEWIGFVDSDDWVAPDFYEKLLDEAERTGADIVGCDICFTVERSFEPQKIVEDGDSSLVGEMNTEKYKRAILKPGSAVTKVYRRSIFYENGLWFPEYTFYEDNCTGVLTMLYCKKFAYVHEPLYFYYQDNASTTHTVTQRRCDDRLTTMVILLEECWKREFLEEFPEELEYRFTEIYYVNTLFSYMLGVPFFKQRISYLRKLQVGILSMYPDFDENPYFQDRQDDEVKRLTRMNAESPFRFFWYYTFLRLYRRIRYGKKPGS